MSKNYKYFGEILSTERVPRWGGFIATVPDNIAKHIARTAIICAMLMELEDDFTAAEKEKTILCIMSRGLLAMTTGDVKKRVKEDSKLSTLLRKAEEANGYKLCEYFDEEVLDFFKENIGLYYQEGKIKKIIKAAKDIDNYLFCYREVEIYHNEQLRDKYMMTFVEVNKWADKFSSVKTILDSITNQNGYFKFLRNVQDMDQVQRWNLKTLIPDNDLIHGFRVASEAIFLGALEKFKFGNDINFYNLTLKGLFHDLQEVIVGDIVMPIKYWNGGEIKHRLGDLEKEVSVEMAQEIPSDTVKALLYNNFTGAMDATLEGSLCNICDQLDAVLHAVTELNVGNKYFNVVLESNVAYMKEHFKEKSIQYFFENIFDELKK